MQTSVSRSRWRSTGLSIAVLFLLFVVACAPDAEETTTTPATVEEEEEPTPAPEEPPEEEEGRFEGVNLRLAVEAGTTLGEPIKPFVAEWEELTGASVEFTEIPFPEIFPKMMTSFRAGTDDFDVVIILPTWFGDMAGGGFLEPLDEFIANDERIAWDDVLPICQNIGEWEGQTFMVPLDCDVVLAYFHRVALNDPDHMAAFEEQYGYPLAPPETWDQYRDIAEYFSENSDVFGVFEAMSRGSQTFWMGLARMVGYVSQGQGWELFFDPDDMTPLINSPGHVQGLQDMVDIIEFGPVDILEFDGGDINQQFPLGQAALAIQWSTIGMVPSDRQNQEFVGFQQIPGPTEVWDHEAGEWIQLDSPNRVGYMAANGWGPSIPATSPNKEAAFDLISYLASPEVSIKLVSMRDNFVGSVGYQPFRQSHFDNVDAWIESEWEPEIVANYLEQTQAGLTGEFVQPDLRIPGAFEYLDALDAGISEALTGRATPQEALDQVAARWDEITDRLGRETQLELYRKSIGLD